MHVAALFVDPDGAYSQIHGVDLWDKARDARLYAGPWPVVAHPPCNLWVKFAGLNYKRYGGDRNRPGNDYGCFAQAISAVRRFGGVLEHPAETYAWKTFYLSVPNKPGWCKAICGGWVCEVWQSAYGHKAQKRTWLYYHGDKPPFDLLWTKPKGTHQVGRFDVTKPVISGKAASSTPDAFRDTLIRLALHSRGDARNALQK